MFFGNNCSACGRALEKAGRSRIHMGIGVSDIHIEGKFGDDKYGQTLGEKKARILEMAVEAVRHAHGLADLDFLVELLEAVVEVGAGVLNIPDTTGYAVPVQYGALIGAICERVTAGNEAVVSVHCHDDLGLAVANTLAGVAQGARQVEGAATGRRNRPMPWI
jgi:2-isopropylmalate synthase